MHVMRAKSTIVKMAVVYKVRKGATQKLIALMPAMRAIVTRLPYQSPTSDMYQGEYTDMQEKAKARLCELASAARGSHKAGFMPPLPPSLHLFLHIYMILYHIHYLLLV